MSAHERMYRLLLRAYPEGFRSAYGREMEQVFREPPLASGTDEIDVHVLSPGVVEAGASAFGRAFATSLVVLLHEAATTSGVACTPRVTTNRAAKNSTTCGAGHGRRPGDSDQSREGALSGE